MAFAIDIYRYIVSLRKSCDLYVLYDKSDRPRIDNRRFQLFYMHHENDRSVVNLSRNRNIKTQRF